MPDRWTHTSPAQQIVAGSGAVDVLAEQLRALGVRRAMLVTTRGRLDSEGGETVVSRCGRALAATFDAVEPHVPAPVVQRGVAELRTAGVDGIVSFGGGSAVDTAKALAFFAEHEAGAPGAGFADRPLLPHVAIPTTLAGAPFTATLSMVDPHARRSTSTGGPTIAPSAVVVDAELGADLPMGLLRTSIAVALAHGVDAAWSATASPEAVALAVAGLAQVAAAAPAAVDEPGDVERRLPLLAGAVLCGRARQNAGDGLQQALAQLLGARAGAPHAAAHAALLVPTTRFVADALPSAQVAAVAGALGDRDADVADLLAALLDRLGHPTRLADLGIDDDDLDAVARQSASQRGVQTCPRPLGEADVRALLDDAS